MSDGGISARVRISVTDPAVDERADLNSPTEEDPGVVRARSSERSVLITVAWV